MSDPAIWTPPASPEFMGRGDVFLEDFDADLLTELDVDIPQYVQILGLSCNSVDSVSFLSHFEKSVGELHWSDPVHILCLLRTRLVVLKMCPPENEQELSVLRNDATFLLASLDSCIVNKMFDKHSVVKIISCIRSILTLLGPLSYILETTVKTSEHLLHAHLEVWITVLKVFNFLCKRTEYGVIVNETLGLKSRSSLNASGYFVDIVLENLILFSGVKNPRNCSCDILIWIVVIHLIEEAQKNWFKFFHGKMMKLSAHQKVDFSEPNTLERLRPDFKAYLQPSSSNDRSGTSLCLWSLYWNVLAHTAPIHRQFMEYITQSKIERGALQKYSVVVWLIRQQFLGESVPGICDVHTCLTSLRRLTETWGISLEVIRSLWLYFKGRLNIGFYTSDSYTGLVLPNISFRSWYAKGKSTDEEMQNFCMFCSLLRKIPSSEYRELCTILQISLLSLTRNGISYYFFIWANLLEEALNSLAINTSSSDNIQKCLLPMVDNIVEFCTALTEPASSFQSGIHSWDPSRSCIVLQCLQYLEIICKECVFVYSDSSAFYLSIANSVVEKINSSVNPLRRSLSPFSESITDSEIVSALRPSTFNRLSASSWMNDFTSISIQFLIDLTDNSALATLDAGHLMFIMHCLGSSYFTSVGWPFDLKWNEGILQLTKAVCSLTPSESSFDVFTFIWRVVYPAFRKAVSRTNTKFNPIPANSLPVLSMISYHFLLISKISSCYKSKDSVMHEFVDPVELFDLLTLDTSVDFSLHFSTLETCFNTSNSVKELLSILSSSRRDISSVAWLFLVTLLAYALMIKTPVHSMSTEVHNDFILPSFISEIRSYLPLNIDSSTFLNVDAELLLINISAYFDGLPTFHTRMTFKSVFTQHISRLCEFIYTCCSVSSSAKDSGFGLGLLMSSDFMNSEDLCSKGYHAAGSLLRHCSMLLYTPVSTEGSASSFENLVNHFFLPRQLYEMQEPNKYSTLSEWNSFPYYILDSMRDQLPEFSRGIAQLNWRSDPYLCRILKDVVKLYYKQLGPESVATVVLNSPSLDFRTHVLQLITQDQIGLLVDSKTAPLSNAERVNSQKNILSKWLDFVNSVYADTHSSEGYQRDAPFLVCPILLAYTFKDLTGTLNSNFRKQCSHILNVYKEAVKTITCKEIRSQISEHCYNLDKKTMDSRCSLITFFGL
uniref:MMS22-like C-terminal domain-containing protein n=1 Tax=Trichobilharzia regenti TaxID=157069 RepID=A0AA85ITB7_TRIRE|nr:unnamed protein product [Trichobilharzia regenti]